MAKISRKQVRDDLLEQLERNGMIGSHCQDMVDDYMELWDIAKALAKDIKKRGVTARQGNQLLEHLMGADVRFMDTDDYADIYAEMDRVGMESGKPYYKIPCGGSNALGTLGYVDCVRELCA